MLRKRQKIDRGPRPAESGDVEINERQVHGQRFAWLLAPVRDLAQNWEIDIAQELEKYIEELGHVVISINPDEGRGDVNFAEAALLIQGSTTVYSKKVEYLYQLCFELVRLLAKKSVVNDQQPEQNPSVDEDGHDHDVSSLRRAGNVDEDFLPLDDMQPCKKINMVEKHNDNGRFSAAAARGAHVRTPMPLSLIPLADSEKSPIPLINASGHSLGRRDDFWMNTSKVHPGTGTLLLDASNLPLIYAAPSTNTFAPLRRDQNFGLLNIDPMSPVLGANQTPFVSPDAPTSAQQPPAEHPQQEITIDAENTSVNDFGGNDSCDNFDPLSQTAVTVTVPPPVEPNCQQSRFGLLPARGRKRRKTRKDLMAEILQLGDPWRDISQDNNENASSKPLQRKPFKKGRPYRVPNASAAADSQTPVLTQRIGNFLSDCLLKRPRNLPKESWKRPTNEALIDVYWDERKRRIAAKTGPGAACEQNRAQLHSASQSNDRRQSELDREAEERDQNLSRNMRLLFDDDDGGGGGAEHDDADNNDSDNDAGNDHGEDAPDLPCAEIGGGDSDICGVNEPNYFVQNDDAIAADTGVINEPVPMEVDVDACSSNAVCQTSPTAMTYEDLVKMRLERILQEAEAKFTYGDSVKRVQEWESKMEPILQRDLTRRPYDIHEYGGDLLDCFNVAVGQASAAPGASYYFAHVAEQLPQWEVCRYFLSSLMLANTGNVQLETSEEEGSLENMDTLKLTLLSVERHHEQFEELAAPLTRPNRRSQ